MTLQDAQKILDARVLAGEEKLDRVVVSACGADLMSDVLAFSKEKVLMLTGLVNPQVVRTAEMMDIRAIMFVRGKCPGDEVLSLAREKSIVIMATEYPMYIACGRLYASGLTGSDQPPARPGGE
jgi:predicted transcriptional regulator